MQVQRGLLKVHYLIGRCENSAYRSSPLDNSDCRKPTKENKLKCHLLIYDLIVWVMMYVSLCTVRLVLMYVTSSICVNYFVRRLVWISHPDIFLYRITHAHIGSSNKKVPSGIIRCPVKIYILITKLSGVTLWIHLSFGPFFPIIFSWKRSLTFATIVLKERFWAANEYNIAHSRVLASNFKVRKSTNVATFLVKNCY